MVPTRARRGESCLPFAKEAPGVGDCKANVTVFRLGGFRLYFFIFLASKLGKFVKDGPPEVPP